MDPSAVEREVLAGHDAGEGRLSVVHDIAVGLKTLGNLRIAEIQQLTSREVVSDQQASFLERLTKDRYPVGDASTFQC